MWQGLSGWWQGLSRRSLFWVAKNTKAPREASEIYLFVQFFDLYLQ
jgi:hypothetical protein